MNKILRICVVYFYGDCTEIYHYANLTVPKDINNDDVECAFNEMYDTFCDGSFYCRETKEIESDGEYLFRKASEKNKWLYSDFIEECTDKRRGYSMECYSDVLAKQLGIEPAHYVITIYDDGV